MRNKKIIYAPLRIAYTLSGYNATISGGENNVINAGFNYATIAGGQNNIVAGTGSGILGGIGNQVLGNCSAILGGSGDTVSATYSYAAVLGQGIAAVANNMFHVEKINAINTPVIPSITLPPGAIVKWNPSIGPLPAGALALYIV